MSTALAAAPGASLSSLLGKMGALGSAELVNRLTRIATAIVLARTLGPLEFGVAAIAITASELLRVFTQSGLGARIVQADAQHLEKVCAAAYRVNWGLYGIVFSAHLLAALPVAWAYGDMRIAGLIFILAAPLLLYPLASVHVFLTQRRNDMRFTAKMLAMQTSLDNLLTAALAYGGFGLWSVALPKLLVAAAWVIAYRRKNSWRPQPVSGPLPYRETITFGSFVLLSEIAGAFRLHGDKFLIASIAGVKLLGTWFFAFNAGVGLTASVITAFGTAFLPHIAALPRNRSFVPAVLRAMGMSLALIAPVVVLQAILAPIYVPILFGASWTHAADLVGILCLSALSLPIMRMLAMVLRATNRPGTELILTLIHALVSLMAVSAGAHTSLYAAAWNLVAVNLLLIPALASIVLFTIRHQLRNIP